jgi:SAM-dependent methyltransferase
VPLIDILIPTFNNASYLYPCVNSILSHQSTPGLYNILIVNNGDKGSIPPIVNPEVKMIEAGANLGWEGGLKLGLSESESPYVIFMNDDTYIPMSSSYWMLQLLNHFADPMVAAVGPSSNCVMGPQNVFVPCTSSSAFPVNFLIGFCMMVRREALENVGGVDDSLPYHGDDLDLSIRFRKAGYKMICDKGVFVYHHGFKTGGREFGSAWNSVEMTEKTNTHLIKKHGLKEFWHTVSQPVAMAPASAPTDSEGDQVRTFVKGLTLELGCGATKSVPDCIGVDIVPKGELIPGLVEARSVADIVADVCEPLPIQSDAYDTVVARHILEHVMNPIKCLKEWGRVIKKGGTLILAVPNQDIRSSIPLNYQHVHAYNPESLKTLMETLGWHTEAITDPKNGISLVGAFTKNGLL